MTERSIIEAASELQGSYNVAQYSVWRADQPRIERINPSFPIIYGTGGNYITGVDPYYFDDEGFPAQVVRRETLIPQEVVERYSEYVNQDSVDRLMTDVEQPISIDVSQIPDDDIQSFLQYRNNYGVVFSSSRRYGRTNSDSAMAYAYSLLSEQLKKEKEEDDELKSTQLFPELSHL